METVWVDYYRENHRSKKSICYYDAVFSTNCPYCGDSFEGSIDELTGNGYGASESFTCNSCNKDFYVELVDHLDEYDDDTDDSDEGCTACGNPAYPDCKSNCRLYD